MTFDDYFKYLDIFNDNDFKNSTYCRKNGKTNQFTREVIKNSMNNNDKADIKVTINGKNVPYFSCSSIPQILKIVPDGDVTYFIWNDNTVSKVTREKNDKPDIHAAFCAALAKKIYGSTNAVYDVVEKATVHSLTEK